MRLLLSILATLVACSGRDDAAFRDGVRHAQLLLKILQEQRAIGNLPDWQIWDPPTTRECTTLGAALPCEALPDAVFHAVLLPDVDRPLHYFRSYYTLWIDLSKDGALKKPGTTYVDVNLVPIGGYEILRINAAPDVELIGAASDVGTADERDGAYHVIIHSGGTLRFKCASKNAAHPFSCDARGEFGDVGIVYRAADRNWHVVGPTHAGS